MNADVSMLQKPSMAYITKEFHQVSTSCLKCNVKKILMLGFPHKIQGTQLWLSSKEADTFLQMLVLDNTRM